MQKWEYKIISVHIYREREINEVTEQINLLGEDGWELAGVSADDSGRWPRLIFKRPKS